MDVIGAVGGLVGAIAAIFTFTHSRRVRKTMNSLKVENMLDEAWDLMGGRKGATEITARTASPADLEEARRKIRDAQKLDGKSSRALRYEGVLHWLQGHHEKARNSFEKAATLSKSPREKAAAYCNLGNREADEGRLEQALTCYKRAIEADFDKHLPHYNLGLVYHEMGDLPAAIEAYEQAIEKNSYFVQAYVYLGRAYIDQGEYSKAGDALEKALELDSEYHRIYFQMGRLNEELGALEVAREFYEQCLKLNPNNEAAKAALAKLD